MAEWKGNAWSKKIAYDLCMKIYFQMENCHHQAGRVSFRIGLNLCSSIYFNDKRPSQDWQDHVQENGKKGKSQLEFIHHIWCQSPEWFVHKCTETSKVWQADERTPAQHYWAFLWGIHWSPVGSPLQRASNAESLSLRPPGLYRITWWLSSSSPWLIIGNQLILLISVFFSMSEVIYV